VDANSAYTLDDVDVFRKLDRFGLMLIEQPLAHDDIIDHAKLQSRIETPICLDESIHTLDDARHALELGSCRVINIKHTRVGGLYHAKRIHDLCAQEGVPVWCGGMLESAVGQCHGIAMASLPNFTLAGDLAPSSRYFHRDLIRPWIEMEDGYMAVPQTPGLGFDVDEDYLEEATTEKVVLR
ncbi:MAG TPA: enolase C-terminal domain-like protein, partial [Planctomycetota bacterium]|nr:enolase C-terminal domain-like protein [Planctomycetota bacterium]